MAMTFHRLMLETALIIHRSSVPGMMHQEKAAARTASMYSLLGLQDTCSINGRKIHLRIKMENIEVSANIKLLASLQPRTALL